MTEVNSDQSSVISAEAGGAMKRIWVKPHYSSEWHAAEPGSEVTACLEWKITPSVRAALRAVDAPGNCPICARIVRQREEPRRNAESAERQEKVG